MRPAESRAILLNVFFCSVEPSGSAWELSTSTVAEKGTFGTGVTKTPAICCSTPRYGGGVDAVSWQNAVGDKRIVKASNEENFMMHFLSMVTSARTMLTQS